MSRFARLEAELAAKGATDPAALAAHIGRRKYGRTGFAALVAAGRARAAAKKAMRSRTLAWEFRGQLEPQTEERLAGQDVTPGHDQLHHYWTRGEGLAKWRGSPHPWTTLRRHLLKYVNPEMATRMASKWFEEVFGYAAGSDLHRLDSGKPPRGHLVGPG